VIPDTDILERRARVVRELPWVIPASVVIEMTDWDLDRLDFAAREGPDTYWRMLNTIVTRIQAVP
jgi:hypothetical protein